MSYGKIFPLGGSGGSTPSGIAGAIQFSNGSAFASDAANLFWDDTNNRLGVGTNAPTAILQAENSTNGVLLARFKDALASTSYIDIKADPSLTDYTSLYFGSERRIMSKQGGALFLTCSNSVRFVDGLSTSMTITPTEFQIGSITGARLGIKGSGSTSATTSLLVQNSDGTELFKVTDDGTTWVRGSLQLYFGDNANFVKKSGAIDGISIVGYDAVGLGVVGSNNFFVVRNDTASLGATTSNASAIFDITSTTKGFLPPRQTVAQRTAIASPAVGLMVYQTDGTEGLYIYKSTGWTFIA